MDKKLASLVRQAIVFTFLTFSGTLAAFEKLPSNYQVAYGNPKAPIQVTEYFSLSCLKCLESFRNDFSALKKKYIETQKVYWVFHLNPADLLTLQAMVCLEKLSVEEKKIFWEVVINALNDPSQGCFIMKVALEALGTSCPQLQDISFLKTTPSFQNAYKYLKQPDIIKELPTMEINGKIHDEFPTRKFIEQQLNLLTSKSQT